MAKSKRTGNAALVVRARPGEGPGATDKRLVDDALAHIGTLSRTATLALAVEIGDYLVQQFFGGDLELARSFRPTKESAFSMLEEQAPSIDMSASQLRIAVAVSAQYRALPAAVRDRLTVRQHRALLPVEDTQEKSKLARRAVSESLSGPELSQLVRQQHGPARMGRKPQGDLERAINAARRVLVSAMLEAALEPAKVRALDGKLRSQLLREARTLRERIERITDALAGVRD